MREMQGHRGEDDVSCVVESRGKMLGDIAGAD